MDTLRIPLLRFPPRVQKLVFRSMNVAYKLAISLLSIKTQKLIKSLRIYSGLPRILIVDCIRIGFIFYSDYFVLEFYDAQILQTNQLSIRYSEDNNEKRVVWIFKKELTVKNWLDHFMDVLNTPKIEELKFSDGGQRFSLESLKEMDLNYETLTIDEGYSDEETLKITKMFLKENNNLQFGRSFIRLQQIFIQNREKMQFPRFQLNDLLVCNSSMIEFLSSAPDKHLNSFLKLWIRGANPRLQRLILRGPFGFFRCDLDVILKGIENVPVSREHKDRLPRYPPFLPPITKKEVDIKRDDETWATLTVFNQFPFSEVMFFVWD